MHSSDGLAALASVMASSPIVVADDSIHAHISSEIQSKSHLGTHFIRNSVQITFRHTFYQKFSPNHMQAHISLNITQMYNNMIITEIHTLIYI
jgi:hypothetical protein